VRPFHQFSLPILTLGFLLPLASNLKADMIFMYDSSGDLVSSCDGGCLINIFGPAGTTAGPTPAYFRNLVIAEQENPQYISDLIAVGGTNINYFQIEFDGGGGGSPCVMAGGCSFTANGLPQNLSSYVSLDFFLPNGHIVFGASDTLVFQSTPEPSSILLLVTVVMLVGIISYRSSAIREKDTSLT
jgi:hypothetical protein